MSNPSNILPPLPQSWSALTWQQLCDVWTAKMRYGGNPDVAAAAALLALTGLTPVAEPCPTEATGAAGGSLDAQTGERIYLLAAGDGRQYTATPRLLAHIARQALPWLQYPYGDQGDKEETDEQGKVIRERREGHRGYVNQRGDKLCDAMDLPEEQIIIYRGRMVSASEKRSALPTLLTSVFGKRFALPQMALMNITWHQYRSIQPIISQMFAKDVADDQFAELRSRFLAIILVPRSPAILDTSDNSVKVRFFWAYTYNSDRAEHLVSYWRKQPCADLLFQICFQVWQTAMSYYALAFPLLFTSDGKSSQTQDALTAETGTLAAIQKRSRAQSPEAVYALPLPVAFTHLNNMAEEAKQIEEMNRKIKRKH